MSVKKLALMFIFLVSLIVLLPLQAFSALDFLYCKKTDLKKYFETCTASFCYEKHNSYSSAEYEKCIVARSDSCYCLTYLGGRYHTDYPFEFKEFAIHGNFCGWRNSASVYMNKSVPSLEVLQKSVSDLIAQDRLDDICKKHDVAYYSKSADICIADQTASAEFLSYAYILQTDSQKAELAIVMSKSLDKSWLTCKVLNWVY